MVEISQFKLQSLFGNPAWLYQSVLSRKGYSPRQIVEFDAEIVSPGWRGMGHVLLVLMVHSEKKAYVSMLDSDAISTMREALQLQQVSLNASELMKPRQPDSEI